NLLRGLHLAAIAGLLHVQLDRRLPARIRVDALRLESGVDVGDVADAQQTRTLRPGVHGPRTRRRGRGCARDSQEEVGDRGRRLNVAADVDVRLPVHPIHDAARGAHVVCGDGVRHV